MKILLRVFLFFLIESVFVPQSVQAASRSFLMRQCITKMRKNPPAVTISYNYGGLHYNTELTSEEIRDLYYKDKENLKRVDSNTRYRGLTLFSFYKWVHVDTSVQNLNKEFKCVYPRHVHIKVGFGDIPIFIDKSIPENSCLYRKTLRHETQHLDDAHTFLTYLVKALQKDTLDIVTKIGPQVILETKEYKYLYDEALYGVIGKHYDKWRAQAKSMDSEENYAAEQKLCPG